jgi:hypothetical protein
VSASSTAAAIRAIADVLRIVIVSNISFPLVVQSAFTQSWRQRSATHSGAVWPRGLKAPRYWTLRRMSG